MRRQKQNPAYPRVPCTSWPMSSAAQERRVQAQGYYQLRKKANQTVCSKVITEIDGELMQEGKQI